jgi:hypothetical protein
MNEISKKISYEIKVLQELDDLLLCSNKPAVEPCPGVI